MSEPPLSVADLAFGYPGSPPLISDVSFDVEAGEMVAVRGPSGAGKSTLMFLLGLFIKPNSGKLTVGGYDTTRLGDRDRSALRAHYIGFVFQDAILHPSISIAANVAEGALYAGVSSPAALNRAHQLLDAYGIADVANRLPTKISGGQAQRAALCRALIKAPSLVLADEPTGNLDSANAGAVVGGLRDAARGGAAVVVVTHSAEVASSCDRSISLG